MLVVDLIGGVGTWVGLMRFLKGLEGILEVGLEGEGVVLRVLGRRIWLVGGEELVGFSEFGSGGGVGLREKEREVAEEEEEDEKEEWCFWLWMRVEKGVVVLR